MSKSPPRVFVVDQAAAFRDALEQVLREDALLQWAGGAVDAETALAQIPRVCPDVVLMSLQLPGMGGLEATDRIMVEFPRPVVLMGERSGSLVGAAARAGAVDLVTRPEPLVPGAAATHAFLKNLRLLASVPVVTRRSEPASPRPTNAHPWPARPVVPKVPSAVPRPRPPGQPITMVCLGASAGGPDAILRILSVLHGAPHPPVLVVQHIARGFVTGMAAWLAEQSGVRVQVATHGTIPQRDTVYLAPDDHHLEWSGQAMTLRPRQPGDRHCPAVNALFESAARNPDASHVLGILLTGMGDDGAAGLATLRRQGAFTVAQEESGCAVYGMPRAAAERLAASEVLSLDAAAARILELGG